MMIWAGEVTSFILKLKSLPMVEASEKMVGHWLKDSDLRSCSVSNDLGVLCILPGN